jgi:hypothetical protein
VRQPFAAAGRRGNILPRTRPFSIILIGRTTPVLRHLDLLFPLGPPLAFLKPLWTL